MICNVLHFCGISSWLECCRRRQTPNSRGMAHDNWKPATTACLGSEGPQTLRRSHVLRGAVADLVVVGGLRVQVVQLHQVLHRRGAVHRTKSKVQSTADNRLQLIGVVGAGMARAGEVLHTQPGNLTNMRRLLAAADVTMQHTQQAAAYKLVAVLTSWRPGGRWRHRSSRWCCGCSSSCV